MPRQSPLSSMEKLSPSVYIYRPPTPTTKHNVINPDPKVILLLGWMDARDVHLAYYINQYRTLYPHSAILLVKARTAAIVFPTIGRKNVQPVVAPLRAILDTETTTTRNTSNQHPQLLIHLFSGGGSSSLYHLYPLLHPLPQHITLLDSAPGKYTYSFASNVFTAGARSPLIKLLIAPVIHIFAITTYLLIKILRVADDNQSVWAAAHNHPDLVKTETRRVYMYSDVDKLVGRETVERHADEAGARGFVVYGRELFKGAGHVALVKSDVDRYWGVVRGLWEGRR